MSARRVLAVVPHDGGGKALRVALLVQLLDGGRVTSGTVPALDPLPAIQAGEAAVLLVVDCSDPLLEDSPEAQGDAAPPPAAKRTRRSLFPDAPEDGAARGFGRAGRRVP